MTHTIGSTSTSPVPSVENKLKLGEVMFQGRTYIATLHYYGEDRKELTITPAMKAAQEVYCKTIQGILNQAEERAKALGESILPGGSLLDQVSTGGFKFREEEDDELLPSPSHEQLKTDEAWKAFLFFLNCPQLAFVGNSHVELTPILD